MRLDYIGRPVADLAELADALDSKSYHPPWTPLDSPDNQRIGSDTPFWPCFHAPGMQKAYL